MKIDSSQISEEEMTKKEKVISLPKFETAYPDACPLTYSLSTSGTSAKAFTELTLDTSQEEAAITVPLSGTEAKTYTFYLVGVNPDNVLAASPKIVITAEKVCKSKLESIAQDKSLATTFDLTVYPDDFVDKKKELTAF